MTINTRGGGVTHTHTHTHTRQGAAVQPSVNPVPSRPRWLVVCFIVRRVCVCALSIGCAPHACEYRLVGCAYAKKSVWLSLLYIHIPYTHTHRQRQHSAQNGVCCAVSGVCLCACVCCCCCCGVRLRWGRNVVGIVSVVVVAAVAAAAAAADMIPRLFIHIVVVVW